MPLPLISFNFEPEQNFLSLQQVNRKVSAEILEVMLKVTLTGNEESPQLFGCHHSWQELHS